MHKLVREMMIDLRNTRRDFYQLHVLRRRHLHTVGDRRYNGRKYTLQGISKWFNVTYKRYNYYSKHGKYVAHLMMCNKPSMRYMLNKHCAWSMCNAMVEDTIRCSEQYGSSNPFDRNEFQDLAIAELPIHSNN